MSLRPVRPGGRYRVAGLERRVPLHLRFRRQAFYTHTRVLNELAYLLEYTGARLDEAGIAWWITQGTLVGAERHAGFIPWDHDADLNVRLEDVPRLLELAPRLKQDGFLLRKAAGGFKLGYARWPSFPYLDLVVMALRQGVWQLAYPLDRHGRPTFGKHLQWPNEAISETDLFPLQRVGFEAFEVWAPREHRKVALSMYGRDCLEMVHSPVCPWLINHYYDALLMALGLTAG